MAAEAPLMPGRSRLCCARTQRALTAFPSAPFLAEGTQRIYRVLVTRFRNSGNVLFAAIRVDNHANDRLAFSTTVQAEFMTRGSAQEPGSRVPAIGGSGINRALRCPV
jgi:hypothetical protein